jgi:hypothetical protein
MSARTSSPVMPRWRQAAHASGENYTRGTRVGPGLKRAKAGGRQSPHSRTFRTGHTLADCECRDRGYARSVGENRQRLDELLRRKRRAGRVPHVVATWAALDVAASPLSADRQVDLIDLWRSAGLGRSSKLPQPSTDPLSHPVCEFAGCRDMLVIVGWDVDEEPAVLLSSEGLNRSVAHLRAIYPDGFVLLDQPLTSALLVDFDEDDHAVIYVERHSLSRPS